jgi:beta-glucosidase
VLDSFVSATVDFDRVLTSGAHSARFTGTLAPPVTGTYRFSLASAGIVRLSIDGKLVASGDSEGASGAALGFPGSPAVTAQGLATLTAGTAVTIEIEYSIGSSIGGSTLRLGWQPPDPPLVAAAVAAARTASVAVVFASDVTGEGMDRITLGLPGDQDDLIAAVAAANPRTIVVLHTAGPVLMPWLDKVAAVIQAWYPGQETGNAIASLLFGDVAPSGRLTMTFPASEDQGPTVQPAQYPGVDDVVRYDEGVFVGYRYYDRSGQAPLFPFGYGLTYTSFALDRLHVTRRRSTSYEITVRVRNTGERDGAAVVQLYVGFPASADEPPNQLKAFDKVAVKAGRSRYVRLTLDRSSFSTWSESAAGWQVPRGTYQLRVGFSSRDLPLGAPVVITDTDD